MYESVKYLLSSLDLPFHQFLVVLWPGSHAATSASAHLTIFSSERSTSRSIHLYPLSDWISRCTRPISHRSHCHPSAPSLSTSSGRQVDRIPYDQRIIKACSIALQGILQCRAYTCSQAVHHPSRNRLAFYLPHIE